MSWARLQSAFHGGTSGGTSIAVTYGTALTSGTKLIAVVGHDGGSGPVMTVKDGSNNAFTLIARVDQGAAGKPSVSIWAMDTPLGDVGITPTITATLVTTSDASILVQEVSGLLAGNTTAMVDGTAGTSSGTASPTTSPAYSSTAVNEYLVACFSDNAFSDTVTDPSAPWTSDANNPAGNGTVHAHVSYKNSTNGAESGAVFTYSNGGAA